MQMAILLQYIVTLLMQHYNLRGNCMKITKKKRYEKPKVTIKKFEILDIISSSGTVGNTIYIGGHEYRY